MWGVIRSVEGDESPTSQAREVLYVDGRPSRAIGLVIRPPIARRSNSVPRVSQSWPC